MNKNLFIIYTPFQLISAISTLALLPSSSINDCLLMHSNMIQYKSITESLFNGKVFWCEELFDNYSSKSRMSSYVKILKVLIMKKRLLKKRKVIKEDYVSMFVPSDDTSCRALYYSVPRNRRPTLKLIDDGTGTYSGQINDIKRIVRRILYFVIFGSSKFYERLVDAYVFRPDLLSFRIQNASTHQIICNRELIKNIFSDRLKDNIGLYCGKKVVFLEQGLLDDEIAKVFDLLCNEFGEDSIIVKKHPRIKSNEEYRGIESSKDGLPFEALATSLNLECSLIVTDYSTACITPYLLLGIKPIVIVVNGIRKNKVERVLDFFRDINQLANSEYILMPSSFEEMKNSISKLAAKVRPIEILN